MKNNKNKLNSNAGFTPLEVLKFLIKQIYYFIFNNKEKTNNKKLLTGFTMLEMIVAVGVFATVAVLSISSLLSLINAQKKALALQSVQDNLRFSMESIARDLRQGDFFYCGATLEDFPNFPGGVPANSLPDMRDCNRGQVVTFLDRENSVVTYRIGCGASTNTCIEKAVRSTYGDSFFDSTTGVTKFNPITSQDIEITRFDFYVAGSKRGDPNNPDLIEPRITVVVDGIVKIGKEESEFNLQTTVSSRNPSRD